MWVSPRPGMQFSSFVVRLQSASDTHIFKQDEATQMLSTSHSPSVEHVVGHGGGGFAPSHVDGRKCSQLFTSAPSQILTSATAG